MADNRKFGEQHGYHLGKTKDSKGRTVHRWMGNKNASATPPRTHKRVEVPDHAKQAILASTAKKDIDYTRLATKAKKKPVQAARRNPLLASKTYTLRKNREAIVGSLHTTLAAASGGDSAAQQRVEKIFASRGVTVSFG